MILVAMLLQIMNTYQLLSLSPTIISKLGVA
jgi:hypothetical protein